MPCILLGSNYITTLFCAVLLVPYLIMLLVTIFAILNLNGCSGDSDSNTSSAVNYTEQGWRHYASGNYAQALL